MNYAILAVLLGMIVFNTSCGSEVYRMPNLSSVPNKEVTSNVNTAPFYYRYPQDDIKDWSYRRDMRIDTDIIPTPLEAILLPGLPYYCDPTRYAPSIIFAAFNCRPYLRLLFPWLRERYRPIM